MLFPIIAALASATLSQATCFHETCSKYSFDLSLATHPDWMAQIPDDIDVTSLSIPGTHNSLTYSLHNELLQTQNTDLRGQLTAGIRYIDVSGRVKDNKIQLYQGDVDTTYDLGKVFTILFDFLDQHPTEALIMRVKKDPLVSDDEEVFAGLMSDYLDARTAIGQRAQSHVYFGENPESSQAPQLGEVRGKVIILQDFPTNTPGVGGIPWNSNTVVALDLEPESEPIPLDIKWSVTEMSLAWASLETDNIFHVTQTNGSTSQAALKNAGGTKLGEIGMNDRLGEALGSEFNSRTRIVAMDFPGKLLLDKFIQGNFAVYAQSK
ncbi:hypothetical protein BROUX41_004600 [Berkeleyomyces rouxiae]|uniref:uncharacterized protein n=1 Tax=Berkeleyomyces rouxiae TaxID=2035830 RepID=UPI003B809C97